MGDEKDTWKVKTLDEILQEKKRRREQEEKTDPKRPKVDKEKEKERENERRKRQREEQDKARREWERQKRREQARMNSRRERDRLEQLERQRERERKLREQQQKEQREQVERERRAEERRKEREARREAASHHRGPKDEYGEKGKQSHRSRSPSRQHRERQDLGEGSRMAVREEKQEDRDLLSDLQDVSESERKTSTAESSTGSGTGSEEEEDTSSESEGEGEGGESATNSEGGSEQTADEVSEVEQTEEEYEEERENGIHIPVVTESRFDHDTEESMEEEEEEEEEDEEEEEAEPSLRSRSNTPEGNYIPESPPMSPVELKKELPKYLPALQGCRSVEEFQCLNRIEEGTYGVVYRAKDKKTDEIVALKRLKMEKEKEGFPITSLREINTILKAQHPNIVTVREIVVGSNMDKIYIVMNYVEHDLKSLMETMKQPFLPGEVKTLMIQLLRGTRHLHDNWILHRDLKTSNLLLSHKGILKIGDFGLAREYGSPLKPYTPVVVTLWYRAPELLLGAKEYSTAIDMWSLGCIFGELLTQKPLFPGKSEIDQINKIFKDLGSPSEKIWPGYNEMPAVKKMTFTEYPYNNLRKRFGALLSDQGFDLMNK
ncbi:UNVERIFIED_CONTAM: hypothetical protein FKN15_060857 [Acipenser sinensis]